MIFYKTEEEIALLEQSNMLVARTLGEISKRICPGISTLMLDQIAEEYIRDNGGKPGFLGYDGFPNTLCMSVGKQVVHGIPSSYELKEGDVLFARSGATVGKSFIFNNYKGRACFAGYLIKASPNPHKLLPDFLYYYTQSSAYC